MANLIHKLSTRGTILLPYTLNRAKCPRYCLKIIHINETSYHLPRKYPTLGKRNAQGYFHW